MAEQTNENEKGHGQSGQRSYGGFEGDPGEQGRSSEWRQREGTSGPRIEGQEGRVGSFYRSAVTRISQKLGWPAQEKSRRQQSGSGEWGEGRRESGEGRSDFGEGRFDLGRGGGRREHWLGARNYGRREVGGREYGDFGRDYGEGRRDWRPSRRELGAEGRFVESGRGGFEGESGYQPQRHYWREELPQSEQGEWSPQREAEERRFRWEREALTARDIMTRNPMTVTPLGTLQQTAQTMKDENCGIVPVVDETHRLLGVITDRDIVVRAVVEDKVPSQAKVQEYMTEDVEAVTPDEEVRDIIELMGKKQIRRMPVVDRDDRLIGIISLSDIANRADYDEELQEALIKISARRSFWNRLFS